VEPQNSSLRIITRSITFATFVIYLFIAVALSLLAFLSFYDVFSKMWLILASADISGGILSVLHALLVTIIIIELLETVTVYFKTSRIFVKPLLIAGLTAMIRRILVFGVEYSSPVDIISTVAAIAVLTAAVLFIGREESMAP
jgi:uncharacterized membrane protein (DUF373 family)